MLHNETEWIGIIFTAYEHTILCSSLLCIEMYVSYVKHSAFGVNNVYNICKCLITLRLIEYSYAIRVEI